MLVIFVLTRELAGLRPPHAACVVGSARTILMCRAIVARAPAYRSRCNFVVEGHGKRARKRRVARAAGAFGWCVGDMVPVTFSRRCVPSPTVEKTCP